MPAKLPYLFFVLLCAALLRDVDCLLCLFLPSSSCMYIAHDVPYIVHRIQYTYAVYGKGIWHSLLCLSVGESHTSWASCANTPCSKQYQHSGGARLKPYTTHSQQLITAVKGKGTAGLCVSARPDLSVKSNMVHDCLCIKLLGSTKYADNDYVLWVWLHGCDKEKS